MDNTQTAIRKSNLAKDLYYSTLTALVDLDVAIAMTKMKIALEGYAHIKPKLKKELEDLKDKRYEQIIYVNACAAMCETYLMDVKKKRN